MKAKIIKKNKDGVIIEWSGKIGFGEVGFKYDGKGGFIVHAEYLGIDTLFQIITIVYNLANDRDFENK